jgi:hypothetical protein
MSNGAVTQEIRLTNSMQGEKSIMVKLKLAYSINGQNVSIVCLCVLGCSWFTVTFEHGSCRLFRLLTFCVAFQVDELVQVSSFPPLY